MRREGWRGREKKGREKGEREKGEREKGERERGKEKGGERGIESQSERERERERERDRQRESSLLNHLPFSQSKIKFRSVDGAMQHRMWDNLDQGPVSQSIFSMTKFSDKSADNQSEARSFVTDDKFCEMGPRADKYIKEIWLYKVKYKKYHTLIYYTVNLSPKIKKID